MRQYTKINESIDEFEPFEGDFGHMHDDFFIWYDPNDEEVSIAYGANEPDERGFKNSPFIIQVLDRKHQYYNSNSLKTMKQAESLAKSILDQYKSGKKFEQMKELTYERPKWMTR